MEESLERIWERYGEEQSTDLRDRLVLHYSPLVKYVVGRLGARLPAHVDQQDLISDGLLGLLDAVERFEPERGHQFPTFAVPRIHGAIIDGLRAGDWLPRRLRSEVRRMEAVEARLETRTGTAPAAHEVAEAMGVAPSRVVELQRTRVAGQLGSLEELTAAEGLPDRLEEPEQLTPDLLHAVATLPEREQVLMALYYVEQLSMAEIGRVLGVTESRVSQLRSRALSRLRVQLTSTAP